MKLKILLVIGTLLLIPLSYQWYIATKPPFLENEKFSCWNDSAIWLLYNMPELVDKLIENQESYKKEDNFTLLFLAQFLEAMKNREQAENENKDEKTKKELDDDLKDLQKLFHQNVACSLTKEVYGNFGGARKLFMAIMKKINESLKDALFFYHLMQSYEVHEDYKKRDYLYALNNEDIIINPKITLTEVKFLTSDPEEIPLKTGNVYTYELIGFIVSGKGHAWTYIKDQREKVPSWYRCDDMRGIEKPYKNYIPPLVWPNEIESYKGSVPQVLLYKKLPTTESIDRFAHAMKEIATT